MSTEKKSIHFASICKLSVNFLLFLTCASLILLVILNDRKPHRKPSDEREKVKLSHASSLPFPRLLICPRPDDYNIPHDRNVLTRYTGVYAQYLFGGLTNRRYDESDITALAKMSDQFRKAERTFQYKLNMSATTYYASLAHNCSEFIKCRLNEEPNFSTKCCNSSELLVSSNGLCISLPGPKKQIYTTERVQNALSIKLSKHDQNKKISGYQILELQSNTRSFHHLASQLVEMDKTGMEVEIAFQLNLNLNMNNYNSGRYSNNNLDNFNSKLEINEHNWTNSAICIDKCMAESIKSKCSCMPYYNELTNGSPKITNFCFYNSTRSCLHTIDHETALSKCTQLCLHSAKKELELYIIHVTSRISKKNYSTINMVHERMRITTLIENAGKLPKDSLMQTIVFLGALFVGIHWVCNNVHEKVITLTERSKKNLVNPM